MTIIIITEIQKSDFVKMLKEIQKWPYLSLLLLLLLLRRLLSLEAMRPMALKAASIMAKKPKVLNPLPIRHLMKEFGKSLQKSFFVCYSPTVLASAQPSFSLVGKKMAEGGGGEGFFWALRRIG